ncbi:MAG: carboxylesterase family protein [Maricaulaceae bacterium]|jgi:para-nitrobenzyl esterase
MKRTFVLCLAACLGACATPVDAQEGAPVATAQGDVAGVVDSGVVSYKGIPFAAPPVGELRWRPPQPPAGWTGVRQADSYGAACPQPDREDGGGVGRMENQSEDCLTLNIWVPADASAGADLPVMVWIHGGAHRLGSGIAPLYDGSELARQGVVLVTINYRLGLLGYFAHPALTADAAPDEPLGNYGIMDQLAALEWVQDNIAGFGGDPDNVTVFGESAGAADTLYLLANPAAEGLFAKAIVESGGGLQRPTDLAAQERNGVQYTAEIGLGADATLADLRAKSAQDWVDAQGELQGGLGFGPFVDGRLVTEPPWIAFAEDRALDVPLIIGANSNEASVLATLGVPTAALAAAIGGRMAEFRAVYGEDTPQADFARQAMGDIVFVAPSRWVAAQAADGAAPSYLYYFSYVARVSRNRRPGANHGSEIPYVFNTWEQTSLDRFLRRQDRRMTEMMSACWVAFARDSAPLCAGAPDWPAYTPEIDQQIEFGEETTVGPPARAAAFDIIVEQFMRTSRR